jgi:hypothetical protein
MTAKSSKIPKLGTRNEKRRTPGTDLSSHWERRAKTKSREKPRDMTGGQKSQRENTRALVRERESMTGSKTEDFDEN